MLATTDDRRDRGSHAAIWYLFSDERLGQAASAFIDATAASGNHIGISAISLAEMVYPIEKERIPINALDDVTAAVAESRNALKQIALDDRIALSMRKVPRSDSRIFLTASLRQPLPFTACPF